MSALEAKPKEEKANNEDKITNDNNNEEPNENMEENREELTVERELKGINL